jgi:hypothetical protein
MERRGILFAHAILTLCESQITHVGLADVIGMDSAARSRAAGPTVVVCGLLCLIFAVVAWSAIRGKSATWDEPTHALTGWLMLHRGDYRLSPDVPPLWEYWIALPTSANAIHFDDHSTIYRKFAAKVDLFLWSVQTLYHTTGNDAIALVNRGRFMALMLGVMLAGLIGKWAWDLRGPVAAGAATFVFILDPNILGHAPLVKNDIAFALLYTATAYAVWRAGRRLTWTNALAVCVLTAAALGVKLSGLLLGPVLVIAFVARAVDSEPWPVLGRMLTRRSHKLAAAAGICIGAAIFTYVGIWASYGFRYAAGPDGMLARQYVTMRHTIEVLSKTTTGPAKTPLVEWHEPLSTKAVLFIEEHHLLPQAWTGGFLLTQEGDLYRGGFLWGDTYVGGRWWYFPLAALFKSPLAEIAAVILSACVIGAALRRGILGKFFNRWAVIAIGVPTFFYVVAILTANLNIGLRHAFPIYPFVFIGVGVAAAHAWNAGVVRPWDGTTGRFVILLLGAMLAAETAAAFPDYIAFFNVAFARNRLTLLSDSNLDWGQDLPLLAAWQKQHPDTILYLDYFGICEPAAYGIRYFNVPGGNMFERRPVLPTKAGVFAVSATELQQAYRADPRGSFSVLFTDAQPEEILGHTIYLFKYDPAEMCGQLPSQNQSSLTRLPSD